MNNLLEQINGSSATVTIESDTEDGLRDRINNYYQEYPATGYGTRVLIPAEKYVDEDSSEKYTVTLQRFLSCE